MIERGDPLFALTQFKKRKQSHGTINDLDNVDFIPSNVPSSHLEALLYVFEDNEAVIKMIADILTKENFTRDEWNHLLCLFNISHFSSAECSEIDVEKNTKRIR